MADAIYSFAGILKTDYGAAEPIEPAITHASGGRATVGLLALAGLEWLRRRKKEIASVGS
jgi:MYXO-CTERM domain-containing protein